MEHEQPLSPRGQRFTRDRWKVSGILVGVVVVVVVADAAALAQNSCLWAFIDEARDGQKAEVISRSGHSQ